MGSESEEKLNKIGSTWRKRRRFLTYTLVAITLIVIVYIQFSKSAEKTKSSSTTSLKVDVATTPTPLTSSSVVQDKKKQKKDVHPIDYSHFDECTTSFQYPNPAEWTTKPLWFSCFPDSLDESTHRNLINGLTGLNSGGKSYYASSPGLRHCFGNGSTATCFNIHPVVEMNRGGPDGKAKQFYHQFIFAIRNPAMVLPSFFFGKQIKYHGAKGQVSVDVWRQHRDTYMTEMMDGWKQVLATWKEMKKYDVGMYVVYEHLLDGKKGSEVMSQLADLLKTAGFVVAPTEDIPCLWYKGIGRSLLERYEKMQYEYEDYVPGYTADQIRYMIKELDDLVVKYEADAALVKILKEYRDDIEMYTPVDSKWVNVTSS